MSKLLDELLLNSIVEVYDGNSKSADYSPNYIRQLMQARFIDDNEVDDGEIEPSELYAYLVRFCQSNEDVITIHFPDGESITLDDDVAKQLITYISTEDMEYGASDINKMHELIARVYDNIIDVKGEL